ncbi:PREDICTED: formin-like protein 5 [Dipodomys ordii]|uniref:Formin-like protein 5 n=1 Tax=Dipodomys ordii TaxID=10020 RepID=A0A1S3FU24_DIPOR|nr:PREDICTED: formin-like protein 5 [Dipodomys ordii]
MNHREFIGVESTLARSPPPQRDSLMEPQKAVKKASSLPLPAGSLQRGVLWKSTRCPPPPQHPRQRQTPSAVSPHGPHPPHSRFHHPPGLGELPPQPAPAPRRAAPPERERGRPGGSGEVEPLPGSYRGSVLPLGEGAQPLSPAAPRAPFPGNSAPRGRSTGDAPPPRPHPSTFCSAGSSCAAGAGGCD